MNCILRFTRSAGLGSLALLLGIMFYSRPAQTQTPSTSQGSSVFYNCTGTSSCTSVAGSGVYIDASQFDTTSTNFCARVNAALNAIPTGISGAVIDARGIGAGGTSTCSTNPFSGITNGSTVLLPAGTINTSAGWVLPSATKVVGSGVGQTIITATTALAPILAMGSSSCVPCQGVGIEDLTLNGADSAKAGILNQNSQEHSYVRNVTIENILGPALAVNGTGSQNSGPYENLVITTDADTTNPACIALGATPSEPSADFGPSGLRGIHNVTCIGNGATSSVGVEINTSNTSLDNISIGGFPHGIVIGNNSGEYPGGQGNLYPVQGVVIENVQALSGSGTATDLIQIANQGNCSSSTCFGVNTTDIEIFGVVNSVYTDTIDDKISNYILTKTAQPVVGMYVLGQPLDYQQIGSFVSPFTAPVQMTRFTTAGSQPSWVTGTTNVSGTTCQVKGSFYSNTSGTSTSDTFFACIPESGGSNEWQPIM